MEVRPDQWMDGDETLAQHPPMDGWGWGGGCGLLSVLAGVVDIDVGDGLQHVDIKGTDTLHPQGFFPSRCCFVGGQDLRGRHRRRRRLRLCQARHPQGNAPNPPTPRSKSFSFLHTGNIQGRHFRCKILRCFLLENYSQKLIHRSSEVQSRCQGMLSIS
ncbi:hypothetical protein VPH35_050742 [Triticum aestivum]